MLYRADVNGFRALVSFLTRDCCEGRPEICAPLFESLERRLFLRTGVRTWLTIPSTSSFSAPAIRPAPSWGSRFSTRTDAVVSRHISAGSHPKGAVNPFALKVLKSFNYPSEGFSSKPWDVFAEPGAPVMDFVFTVCDDAAGEACPVWPGQPMTAHWGIDDPAKVEGTDIEKEAAFVQAFKYLKNRIGIFTNLPLKNIGSLALTRKLREIGEIEGSTSRHVKAS